MKVYLIHTDDSDDFNQYIQIYGIVSSEKKAEQEIERLERDYPRTNGWVYILLQ